jgi:hypothetical protein
MMGLCIPKKKDFQFRALKQTEKPLELFLIVAPELISLPLHNFQFAIESLSLVVVTKNR